MDGKIGRLDSIRSPEFKMGSQLAHETGREKYGCYLIEGEQMIEAALTSPSRLVKVFVTGAEAEGHPLVAALVQRDVPTLLMKKGMLFKMLGTSYKTTTWCVGVVEVRQLSLARLIESNAYLMVLGENIQDPRNVGVMTRTAEAAGAGAFLLTADSADPYCRAAVRSTTGSILRLPAQPIGDLVEVATRMKDAGYRLYGTSVTATTRLWETEFPLKSTFVFGNETRGMSEQARTLCDELVAIPIRGGAHSLNVTVAMGVCLFEWRRQYLARRNG